MLVNPLLGFTVENRPVYWRVLAYQSQLYNLILQNASRSVFGEGLSTEIGRLLAGT